MVYDSPKPPAVADHYRYWADQPPEPSARALWWVQQILRGWRPNRRIGGEGYDGQAQWYGVWLWEFNHVITPLLSELDAKEAVEAAQERSTE